jgi:hypothetical protein
MFVSSGSFAPDPAGQQSIRQRSDGQLERSSS